MGKSPGQQENRGVEGELRTKDGTTGVKEAQIIVLMHITVGTRDAFSEKPLPELCNKAENLCNL